MSVNLRLYPYTLGDNECYLFMQDDFTATGNNIWNYEELLQEFGKVAVDEIFKNKFIIKQRQENVKMAFAVSGTDAELIVRYVSREIFAFQELISKFPKSYGLTSQVVRNYLIHLTNFGIIQTFTLPASAITCIALEESEEAKRVKQVSQSLMDRIDRIYDRCKPIEERFLFTSLGDESAKEFRNYQ